MKPFLLIVLLSVPGLLTTFAADEKLSAQAFAGADGKLTLQQAALYIAHRDKEPLSKFIKPGKWELDPQKVYDELEGKVDDLGERIGHPAPWTWEEVDALTVAASKPSWQNKPGLTVEKKWKSDGKSGSYGPIRLRASAADIAKSVGDAKGLTFGFADNHLIPGHGVWNSEGLIFYPITRGWEDDKSSRDLLTGPMVNWKLVQTEEKGKQDVEEVTYSFPVTFLAGGGRSPAPADDDAILSAFWVWQANPYYQTDFSSGHQIYGAETTLEFVGGVPGTKLYVGAYQNLGRTNLLQYQLRIIPKIDYSEVHEVGPHSTRKLDDDWLRLGATVSFDLRLSGVTVNPIVLGVSYQFLQNIKGEDDYSDLFKAKGTWWLNPNAGLTLEYSDGETPVAAKPIDLFSLSLELKY